MRIFCKPGARRLSAASLHGAVAVLLALGLGLSVCAGELVKADSLVGTSVVVQNVYRSSGGITITKLRSGDEVEAARKALQSALKKYPASFITRVLETVYVGSELKMSREGKRKAWGGLYRYQDRTIFMTFTGDPVVFECIFHHELAHGIHLGYREHFDVGAWLAANPPGFEYTGAVDAGAPSHELLQQGFVRPYAMFSLQEDVACLAESLIGNTEAFAGGVGRFEAINRKARLLIALYQAVDPLMTVSYFRLQQATAARSAEAEGVADGEGRGRPLLVSSLTERGAYLGNFRAGDRVTVYYRDGSKSSRSKTRLTFESESPSNIALCRRRKGRAEPELTVLAAVPRLRSGASFAYTFEESCAAVLKMDGETADGVDRVRFEFEIERDGRH